jgi:hypothetical protein
MNQKITKTGTSCLAIAAALCGAASDARADPVQELKAQVDLLVQKIADLEQKQRAAESAPPAAPPPNAVTAGATKGPFKLPGSDTSVTLGGYAKLDAVSAIRARASAAPPTWSWKPATFRSGPMPRQMSTTRSSSALANPGCLQERARPLHGVL